MCRQWLIAGLLVGYGFSAVAADDVKTADPVDSAIKAAAPEKPEPVEDGAGKPESTPGEPAATPDKPTVATADELSQWVQDLVNPKFATRQSASRKLIQAGKPGIEAVAQAGKTDDLELATRCLAVLTEGLNSKTPEVQDAAKSALQNLAKSENKSVAQRARLALEAPIPLGALGRAAGARNIRQINVNIVNGVREINLLENGKETIIKDTNGKDISVTTTETIDGKKVTKTAEGKDLEDLKKNHPDAHAIAEKLVKGGNAGQIQFGINMNANRVVFGQPPGLQAAARLNRVRMIHPLKAADAFDEIDKLRQKLEESNEKLSKAAESDKPDTAELKAISAEIKTLTKRLTDIRTELQLPQLP